MLNIIEMYEEIMYSKEDKINELSDLILNPEFTDMNSMADIIRVHDNFLIPYSGCNVFVGVTPTGSSNVHHTGTLNSDVAIMSLSVLVLLGEFSKKSEYVDDILEEINENAKWCGNTPFDVFCMWERIEESDGPIHKILRYHRSRPLRFGAVKVPDNFTMEETKKKSNPEKIERRTRIW